MEAMKQPECPKQAVNSRSQSGLHNRARPAWLDTLVECLRRYVEANVSRFEVSEDRKDNGPRLTYSLPKEKRAESRSHSTEGTAPITRETHQLRTSAELSSAGSSDTLMSSAQSSQIRLSRVRASNC